MNKNKNLLKSKFCQWAQNNLPLLSYRKFVSSLTRVLDEHINECDNKIQIMIRDLVDSENISFNFYSKEVIITPNDKCKSLFVGVLMPSWDRGLSRFCNDENVYQIISGFFHFASQFVARSRMVDLMAALNLVYGRSCDFRGDMIHRSLISNDERVQDEFLSSFRRATEINDLRFRSEYRAREKALIIWLNMINSLDPFIHRMLFNFINAYKLYNMHFDEEAITSLDKTVDVVQQYARERMGINGTDNQRELTLAAIGMSEFDKNILYRLYDIRNFFGAHPSVGKWWDFSELFGRDIESFFEVVKRLIYKTLLHENNNRVVKKYPSSWSEWFGENSMILWESVWFEKIHKYIR